MLLILLVFFFTAESIASKYVYHVCDNDPLASTLTTPTQRGTVMFEAEAEVDYLVRWGCEINVNSPTAGIVVTLQQDDTTVVGENVWYSSHSDAWRSVGGFLIASLSVGSHHFDIDFKSTEAGEEVSVRRTRIIVNEIEK